MAVFQSCLEARTRGHGRISFAPGRAARTSGVRVGPVNPR
ncbi:hypothetical protein SHJG_4123 [Streptomyces hygroscopicus subsp. jinggangensis 5008]|nr:hypothetical protein SHJG_4123 [Streptomyces hygroscopicus subsp. jinggangensis 5008]AGF63553.1 hypothetical protein SHJGH_3888 [Streptomyces hygroscopicus subsp. jinggangensis TL01]